MYRHSARLLLALAWLVGGCGPSVNEVRMAHYSPREDGCSLELMKTDMQHVSPGGEWELIGHVIVGEQGSADVLSPEHRELVRPRACRMGGEAIMIMASATSQGVMADGSSTAYGVLRKRRNGEAAAPQRF